MPPTNSALAPGHGHLIQLAWIRLFYAIVSEKQVRNQK